MIVIVIVVVVLVVLVAASLALRRRDESTSRFEQAITTLDADLPAGSVKVGTGDDSVVIVHRQMRWLVTRPKLEERVDDGVLRLRVTGSPLLSGVVEYEVTVPRAVDVTVRSRAGALEAEGVGGRVDLDAVAGSVSVAGLTGEVRLHSASGAVKGTALTSPRLRASTAGGSVGLEFVSAPDEVDVETSVGSVEIALPAGTYAVDAEAAAGTVHVEVDQDLTSEHRIRVRTGAGAVRVITS